MSVTKKTPKIVTRVKRLCAHDKGNMVAYCCVCVMALEDECQRYKEALEKIVDSNLDCPSCLSPEIAQKALHDSRG